MTGNIDRSHVGTCPACHKRSYKSRRLARAAAHRAHPHAHLNAYRCPHGYGWHIGHLPTAVRTGQLGRGDIQNGDNR